MRSLRSDANNGKEARWAFDSDRQVTVVWYIYVWRLLSATVRCSWWLSVYVNIQSRFIILTCNWMHWIILYDSQTASKDRQRESYNCERSCALLIQLERGGDPLWLPHWDLFRYSLWRAIRYTQSIIDAITLQLPWYTFDTAMVCEYIYECHKKLFQDHRRQRCPQQFYYVLKNWKTFLFIKA